MSLAMFGITTDQSSNIDVLNQSINNAVANLQDATKASTADQGLKAATTAINNEWMGVMARYEPKSYLSDADVVNYTNQLQNILNRLDAMTAQFGGTTVNDFTPGAVAGGSVNKGSTIMTSNPFATPGSSVYAQYVNKNTTTAKPFDPSIAAPGKIPVKVSTADQISQIADSLFGAVDSGAKQLFMIKSMQLAQKGKPIQVPSNSTASGGGFSTNEKLAVGGVAVLGIGLLIFALARGR
jgi:hypothetical protein